MKLVDITENIVDIPATLKQLGIDINKCTIRPDGTVDVKGNVDIPNRKLDIIPIQFGVVSGNFNCSANNLKSLQGSPKEVTGDFECDRDNLTSLQGAPREVGGDFDCHGNKVESESDHSFTNIGGKFRWRHI
jgi:hypothetical protein